MMFTKLKNWYMDYCMRGALVEALREDLKAAVSMFDISQQTVVVQQMAIETLVNEITELRRDLTERDESWWKSMDEELSKKEAEERSDEVQIDVQVGCKEELDDIPF